MIKSVVFLLCVAVPYALISFVTLEMNPFEWRDISRFIFVVTSGGATAVAGVITMTGEVDG